MKTAVLLLLLIGYAAADLYCLHPRGSNDRNRERNDNRNNGNRLFDSQNNAKGGGPYAGNAVLPGPDPLVYYVGSILRIEWQNQHSCGPSLKYTPPDGPDYPNGAAAWRRSNVHCDIIGQYICDDGAGYTAGEALGSFDDQTLAIPHENWIYHAPGLRDGYPTADVVESDNDNAGYTRRQFDQGNPCDQNNQQQNADGTNTIPENCYQNDAVKRAAFYNAGADRGTNFGMHEDVEFYNLCRRSERNKGLYVADQQVNRNDARGTRQNPNGNRRGLECPEERDYYPWWKPAPFRDLFYLTHDLQKCEYVQNESFNVKAKNYCSCDQNCRNQNGNNGVAPFDAARCVQSGGKWITAQPFDIPKPECALNPVSRDNHLGNAMTVNQQNPDDIAQPLEFEPQTAFHYLTIPKDMAGKNCVLRLRYNMSTADADVMAGYYPGATSVGIDQTRNCPNGVVGNGNDDPDSNDFTVNNGACYANLTRATRPLVNRPYVRVFQSDDFPLSLAINTHQTGRTFQDRTYLFRVEYSPVDISGLRVFNLNSRGRRGNIVQCYPFVEYDFVPQVLTLSGSDIVHVQVSGSDFNAAKNANNGEGWQYSDRFNWVQTGGPGINYPLPEEQMTMFPSIDIAKRFALLDQPLTGGLCDQNIKAGDNNEQNRIDNCGKLNRAPNRFPPNPADGLLRISPGTHYYMSTRNNNFSNRSQKGRISAGEPDDGSLSDSEVAGIVVGSVVGVGVIIGIILAVGAAFPASFAGGAYLKAKGCCGSKKAAPDMEYTRHAQH